MFIPVWLIVVFVISMFLVIVCRPNNNTNNIDDLTDEEIKYEYLKRREDDEIHNKDESDMDVNERWARSYGEKDESDMDANERWARSYGEKDD